MPKADGSGILTAGEGQWSEIHFGTGRKEVSGILKLSLNAKENAGQRFSALIRSDPGLRALELLFSHKGHIQECLPPDWTEMNSFHLFFLP